MKAKILFILALSVTVISNSCKEKDCKENGTCPPEYYRMRLGEAKSYIWAKKGSYWIYKQTVTGDLDTQTVTEFLCDSITVKGTQNYSQHITIEYDKVIRQIYSSFHNKIFHDETGEHTPDDNSFKNHKTKVFKQEITIVFFHPFEKDFIFATGSEETTCKEVESTMVVQGKTYYNVVKFAISLDGLWENSPPFTGSVYYWAKDVGLIKRSATHKTDNWELIDSYIIQ